jgi:hypothetical protein
LGSFIFLEKVGIVFFDGFDDAVGHRQLDDLKGDLEGAQPDFGAFVELRDEGGIADFDDEFSMSFL